MTRSAADLRETTPQELLQVIAETRRSLLDLRFQNASGELENTAGLRETRRELARALTVARERDLDVVELAEAAPSRPTAADAGTDSEPGEQAGE